MKITNFGIFYTLHVLKKIHTLINISYSHFSLAYFNGFPVFFLSDLANYANPDDAILMTISQELQTY